MDFCSQLNIYIEKVNCTSKELSESSKISAAVISRYRSGDRIPNLKSEKIEQLAIGLANIAKEKNMNLSKETIFEGLSHSLNNIPIDFEQMRKNFNEIIEVLNINVSDLSRFIGFDASLISRIRTGSRNPSKPKEFIEAICKYIVRKYSSNENIQTISNLINCSSDDLLDDNAYLQNLNNWISSNSIPNHNYINDFLNNLDNFNLDEYIKAIHFNEIKIPFVPFYKINSKNYYGLEEMKQGELDFFKATVLSHSNAPIFMCSDMPMEDMAKDLDFGKKWMFAIAASLKKGLHLNMIHNIDRPFNEMMIGLESWIPIYMTGQVSPFYLPNNSNNVYQQLNYVSGNVALTGECIKGSHNKGKYFLTCNKEQLGYFQKKAELLLKKSKPLMEIYNIENKNDLEKFIQEDSKQQGTRHNILSSLPIYTISVETLNKVLDQNNIDDKEKDEIINYVTKEKQIFNNIITSNKMIDDICELSIEEFNKYPAVLSISKSFTSKPITYAYNDYINHLKETKAIKNENYKLKIAQNNIFRNINIYIHCNKWVMISKNTTPTINFVIHHPKLRDAIENFTAPITE